MGKRSINRDKPQPPEEGEVRWIEDTEGTAELERVYASGHDAGIREGIKEGRIAANADRREVMAFRQLDVLHNMAQAYIEVAHCMLRLGMPLVEPPYSPMAVTPRDEKR